jgi:hypothetical protein
VQEAEAIAVAAAAKAPGLGRTAHGKGPASQGTVGMMQQ